MADVRQFFPHSLPQYPRLQQGSCGTPRMVDPVPGCRPQRFTASPIRVFSGGVTLTVVRRVTDHEGRPDGEAAELQDRRRVVRVQLGRSAWPRCWARASVPQVRRQGRLRTRPSIRPRDHPSAPDAFLPSVAPQDAARHGSRPARRSDTWRAPRRGRQRPLACTGYKCVKTISFSRIYRVCSAAGRAYQLLCRTRPVTRWGVPFTATYHSFWSSDPSFSASRLDVEVVLDFRSASVMVGPASRLRRRRWTRERGRL